MNAMSREGWTPKLDLWEDEGTLLDAIVPVTITDQQLGETFTMYHTSAIGHSAILKQLMDIRYTCSVVRSQDGSARHIS